MKTRIIALLLALLTLSTLLSSCENETENTSSEASVEEKTSNTTASAKDIFINSLNSEYIKMLFGTDYEEYDYINLKGSATTPNFDLEEDAIIGFDINMALQERLVDGKVDIETGGEKLTSNIIFDGLNGFISVPEINRLPVIIEDVGFEIAKDMESALYPILMSYLDYIDSGKLDSCFTSEKGDIIFRNVQFKEKEIFTFEITDEKAKEILGEEYNKDISRFDISAKLQYVEKDGKIVAFTAEIDTKNTDESQNKEEYSIKIDYSEDGIDLDFSIDYGGIQSNVNFTHNNVSGNQNGKIEIESTAQTLYTQDPTDSSFDTVETKTNISIDYKNGKGNIKLSVSDDMTEEETTVTLPFGYGIDENGNIYFEITEIEMKSDGVTVALDIYFKLTFKPIEKGLEFSLNLDSEIGELPVLFNLNGSVTEIEKFEVETPEEHLDESNRFEAIDEKIFEEYPAISDFLGIGYLDENEYIKISDEDYAISYTLFPEDGMGWFGGAYIYTDSEEEKDLLGFNFKDVSVDENGIGTVEIEGMEFVFEKTTLYGDVFYYAEYYHPENGALYFNLDYSYETLAIYAGFTFISEGDEYTLTFADGTTVTKTILYNEETESYYFAE